MMMDKAHLKLCQFSLKARLIFWICDSPTLSLPSLFVLHLSLYLFLYLSLYLFLLSPGEQHNRTKSMWTPAGRTSHSKIMCINMELVPPLLLQQPPLFWEGFPLDVGTLLWELASI